MRPQPKRLLRQRAQTDAKLAHLRPLLPFAAPPHGGWLKTIREGLGMTAAQLARRMGISKQAVARIEANEVRRTVSLDSLDRAARALGCRVVHAIVPEESLKAIVDRRARLVAERKLGRVGHSMSLEAQQPPHELNALQVAELAREIREKVGRELWDEP